MSGLFKTWKNLRRDGVLGINRRNADFIMPCNPRRLYPLVDDKLLTKQLAVDAGIAVPELYAVISTQHEAQDIGTLVAPYDEFVIKPANGSQGDGIMVITSRNGHRFGTASGRLLEPITLTHQISNILSGQYSLGGVLDRAFIEYRVKNAAIFDELSCQGVPDIRVIVYRGVPVMAMLRLPTMLSGGKANLHQGAVGCGIDMEDGVTLNGVMENEAILDHPDTGYRIAGLGLPGWRGILELAARCADLTGLGYLGVDIVLDRTHGPLVLELNARPGLNIQIANSSGLGNRLRAVDEWGSHGSSLDQRLDYCTRVLTATAA